MAAGRWEDEPLAARPRPQPDEASRPASDVLASRLAAALVHHEPGWRLPRHTALARRYNVSPAEIESAVGELVSRHLIRRLADGQLYRASPAEYLLELEGVSGLSSTLDPMGCKLTCRSRQVSWRRVPEDIGWALGLESSEAVCVARFLWAADGEPAACSTTYLPGAGAGPGGADAVAPDSLSLLAPPGEPGSAQLGAAGEDGLRGPALTGPAALPRALHIEMQPPPPAVARSLRLPAGQPATIVTVRFDDLAGARPVALTVAVLRSDMFRVVLQSPRQPLADGSAGSFTSAWTHVVEDWES